MKLKIIENSPNLWIKNFPWKKNFGHKYSRGRVVIYGGKKESTGATILASESSLRTGAGSLKVVCTRETLKIYSLRFPSILKEEINNIKEFEIFLKKEKITSILIGPGSGKNQKTKEITKLILKKIKYVVVDADALTSFQDDLQSLYTLLDKNKIITPHIAEFHKVFPKIKKNLNRVDKAIKAVQLIKSNLLLKGSKTLIVSHRKKIIINQHSSPELAVIGSGDVLAGIIVSLISDKKMSPFLSAAAAAWMHGDIAINHGNGLIAEDIVKGIPAALNRLKKWKI